MVKAVREGMSLRQAAAEFGFAKSTVERWVARARSQRLDRVDFSDQKPGRAWNRISPTVEQRIAELRSGLRNGILGEYGARAIHASLQVEMERAPSQATINRALARLGLQDKVRRTRRPAPPKGWYLPDVAGARAELDCFDFIEDLKIAEGPLVELLTAKSLHGSLTDAWVVRRSTEAVLPRLLARWQRDGLPRYAQFDNDTVFQGPHQHAHAVGRVSRLCLQLGVTPVFAPPLEHGIQNTIESFNGLWQAKLWLRYRVASVGELQRLSDRYIAAHRARTRALAEAAPIRQPMPSRFEFKAHATLRGQIIFIRRTNEAGEVHLLGLRFAVSRTWAHRLVRCEVDFDHHHIRCFALRRREPAAQPLLAVLPYRPPHKPRKGEA